MDQQTVGATSGSRRVPLFARRFRLGLSLAVTVAFVGSIAVVAEASSAGGEADRSPTLTALQSVDTMIEIEFDGSSFTPQVARGEPGAIVQFANTGPDVLAVSDLADRFDLSPIPGGGGGALALPPGAYEYEDVDSGATGRILIGSASFGAPADDPVADHIPDAWFPEEVPAQRPLHPDFAVGTSTSRVLVTFAEGATVAEAEAALDRAGAVLVGGLPSARIVLALVAGTADHSALDAALASLVAESAVVSASGDRDVTTNVLPAPPSEPLVCPFRRCPAELEFSARTTGGLPLGDATETWVHEAPRFPQAWNVADAAQEGTVVTAVIDSGFDDAHRDLPNLDVRSLCIGDACSETVAPTVRVRPSDQGPPIDVATGVPAAVENNLIADDIYVDAATGEPLRSDAHGSHVAGLIGAAHDAAGFGIAGADPGAEMIGLQWKNGGVNTLALLAELLDQKQSGSRLYEDVRVINLSVGTYFAPSAWAARHPDLTCGPGIDDDDQPGAAGPCLPWTEDATINSQLRAGANLRPLLERARSLDVVIVQSAGNDGATWCVEDGRLHVAAGRDEACVVPPRPLSFINSELTAGSYLMMRDGAVSPVITVEAIGGEPNGEGGTSAVPSVRRTPFSQMDGDVSSPGYSFAPSTTRYDGVSKHFFSQGTSMAAPIVAGLVSYLIRLDPNVDVAGVRERIATFDDTFDPEPLSRPSPRIDAFGSVLRIPGALEALLDIDDGSADGNRRVIYEPGGGIAGLDVADRQGEPLATDRTIDIADFRRFRDAWLAGCLQISPEASCDELQGVGIDLDGGDQHPKRDLNEDGCVATEPPAPTCPTSEGLYARADFNGDAKISRTDTVPIEVDAASAELTDLGVLASRFAPAADGEGWYAPTGDVAAIEALLDGLLISGDVTVDVAGLRAAGGTDIEVALIDGGVGQWARPVPDDDAVLTVPAGREVEIVVSASRNGEAVAFSDLFTLEAGEDVRYDPCGVVRLTAAGGDTVALGGSTTIVAELESCDDIDLSGVSVDFDVPDGFASVDPTSVTTGVDGTATTSFLAGATPGTFHVTATADLPISAGTIPVDSTIAIEVTEGYATEILTSAATGLLGKQPSIAVNGDVVFTRRSAIGGPLDEALRADGITLESAGGDLSNVWSDGYDVGDRIDAIDDDEAAAQVVNFVEEDNGNLRLDSTAARFIRDVVVVLMANGRCYVISDICIPFGSSVSTVGLPVGNAEGDYLFSYQRAGESISRLANPVAGGLTTGPALGVEFPRLADDQTSVGMSTAFPAATTTGSLFVPAIVEGTLDMGAGDIAAITPIAVVDPPDAAAPTGWTLVGDKPDISASGDVIAFIGDRGAGPSVYVSVRVDGSFTQPVPVAGPARPGLPELVLGDQRQHLVIDTDDFVHDFNVGVVHHPAGPDGLDGDQVIVALPGRPENDDFGGGLYTVPFTMNSVGTPTLGDARPVVELGEPVDGSPVTLIGWHRVLSSDGSATDPERHRLGYWVRTEAGEHIVRSTWEGAPRGVAPQPFRSRMPIPTRMPTPDADDDASPAGLRAAQVPFPGGGSGPILGVIVSDLTPELGQVVGVTWFLEADGSASIEVEYPGNPSRFLSDSEPFAVQPDQAGAFPITVRGGFPEAIVTIELDVQAPPGVDPVADAGGPYAIESGDDVVLDASASTDADGEIVTATWDIDADGTFGDATGERVLVPWSTLVDRLCGGNCVDDADYPITVRVTDDDGLTSTATTNLALDVVIVDFTLALVPAEQFANRGEQYEYRVEVGSIGGFTGVVQLSVDDLPTGFRANLTRSNVQAPGSTTLNVFVPTDAPEENVPIVVRGVSGALEHDTTGSADVTFGLIPICYEPVTGIVVDSVTGEPIEGAVASVRPSGLPATEITVGVDGRFLLEDVQADNRVYLRAQADGYHTRDVSSIQRCGDPIDARIELVEREFVTIRGEVVVGVPDPTDTSRQRTVVASDQPVEGATVTASTDAGLAGTPVDATPADGSYEVDDVPLSGPDNPPIDGVVRASLDGYWPSTVRVRYADGPAIRAEIPIVPVCTVRVGVRGRVTDGDGNPLEGRSVQLNGPAGPPDGFPRVRLGSATTDADGYYEVPLTESFLGVNNSAFQFTVTDAASSSSQRGSFQVERCGDEVMGQVDYQWITFDPPPSVQNRTTITGRLVDAVTGEPVPSMRVQGAGTDRADSDGTFELNALVGSNEVTLRSGVEISALESIGLGYRGTTVGPITLVADVPYDLGDIPLQPVEYAGVRGQVRDIATGEPIVNARVEISNANVQNIGFCCGERTPVVTDENGFYEYQYVAKSGEEVPFTTQMRALQPLGVSDGEEYWPQSQQVEFVPGETGEQDFEMLRICSDATVRGLVIDAQTREPIEGASVVTNLFGVGSEPTGPDGLFLIEDITPGFGNNPRDIRLTASASGYITQQRDVTVFCGATINVTFGADAGSGDVIGTVTDDGGNPIEAVFIGSEAGGADETITDGTYRLADLPLGVDGGPTDWLITAIHPDGRRQEQTATITLDGETVVDFVFPTVDPPENRPPVLDAIDDITIGEGDSTTIAVTATDPDGDPITLDATGLPGWIGFVDDGGGAGRIVLDPADDGTAAITIEACANGDCVTDDVNVTVNNVAPSVGANDDGPVPWGTDVQLDATASDPSPVDDAALTYEWDLDGDGGYDTSPSASPGATTSFPTPGTRTLRVRVCDDDTCTEATTDVEITRRPTVVDQLQGVDGQYSDPTTVSARLLDGTDSTPIVAADLVLELDAVGTTVTTGADGVATATSPVDAPAGTLPVGASFGGDDRYEPGEASGEITVSPEDATLSWNVDPDALSVAVSAADDGTPGDLGRAAVTFSVSQQADCTEPITTIGPIAVVDDGTPDDGVGTASTPTPDLAGVVCILAELTDPADSSIENGFYAGLPAPDVIAGATVLIDKVVTGGAASPGDFVVELFRDGAPYTNAIDDDAGVCDAATRNAGGDLPCIPARVAPGTYALGERPEYGYRPGSISCVDVTSPDVDPPELIDDAGATFTIPDGDDVVVWCTLENVYQEGRIIVTKSVVNDHGGSAGPEAWTMELFDDDGRLAHDGQCDADGNCLDLMVPVGRYRVGETGPDAYTTELVVEIVEEAPVEALPGDDAVVDVNEGLIVLVTATSDDVEPPPTTTTTTTTTTPTSTTSTTAATAPTSTVDGGVPSNPTTTVATPSTPVPEPPSVTLPATGTRGVLSGWASLFLLVGLAALALTRRRPTG